MAIHQTARYDIPPGEIETCLPAIEGFVAYIRDHEPDTTTYVAMRNADESACFLHVIVFRDEAARERHANSDAVQRFQSVLYPRLQAPVEFTTYNVVAAK